MKFSAEDARRKWPCGGFRGRPAPMVTIGAVLLALSTLVEPATAARKSERPQGALADETRPKSQAAAESVPLPKPRPAEAPASEPERQAAAPPPSACRLALTDEVAIAPSIPDIHGPGGCGGEDLVRLEAVVLPDKRLVSVKPAAILRCAMASEIADWIRTDIAPACRRTVDLAHRSCDVAGPARERAAVGVRAIFNRARAGLGLVSRGPRPS